MFFIGILPKNETLKVAILKREKQAIFVDCQTLPFHVNPVKQFYNLPPFHTGKKIQVVSGLNGSEIFLRKLTFPLRDKRKILSALPFQLETQLPFPLENVIVCPLLKRQKQITVATIIATIRESLSSHLLYLKEAGITPDCVSCAPVALARFSAWCFPKETRILSFASDEEYILCVLSEGNEVIVSQSIPFKHQEEILTELEKFLIFLKQKGVADEQIPWILTGNDELGESIRHLFTRPELQVDDPRFKSYAIPIGLALDALTSDDHTVQFCQKEFTPQHVLGRRKKKLGVYLLTCFAATLLSFTTGTSLLRKKQHTLMERLHHLLPATWTKKSFNSVKEMQEILVTWEKSLQQQTAPLTLILPVPKVSDVLAWLSTHPAFSTEEGGKKEGMEIKSLHYSLTKYPKIDEKSTPYLGQLEIEFTTAIPRLARDFHEALLKGDAIANAKKEVKWQVQNQTYYTCFELSKGELR